MYIIYRYHVRGVEVTSSNSSTLPLICWNDVLGVVEVVSCWFNVAFVLLELFTVGGTSPHMAM